MIQYISVSRNLLLAAVYAFSSFVGVGNSHAKPEVPQLQLDPQKNVANYMSCLADQGVTLISAHRGGPQPGFPENALESMQAATQHGPMLLEVDVRETADGHLVLLHDSTLERTTTGKGNLNEYTLAELAEVRLRDNQGQTTTFGIPTLAEVLGWADDRAIVQLDVKRGVDYAKVARAVVEADAVDSVLIIAYRLDNAVTALKVNKHFSFSYSINSKEDLRALDRAGVPREQIVAWTGVVENDDKPIWPLLESQNIPAAAGAFWNLEKRILQSGDTQPYIDLSKTGVDVIGSDHYKLAFNTLAKRQDVAGAIASCQGR